MKKKNIAIITIIFLLIIGITAVSFFGSSTQFNIVGSSSVQPVAEKLVESYKETHPDVRFNVQGGGSSVGIKSVHEGIADIGTSSRELKENEDEGLTQYNIGQEGIVIAVNNQNTVTDLSKEQLKDIFSGKVKNWNQVGGPDGEIHVITREEGSGTLDAFKSIVLGKDTDIRSDAIVQSSTESVKQSVKQDENAIGFVSYAHMSDDIKAVNVNGVAPSDATIADGTYELQRPFLFLTNGEPTGETKNFIDWVLSDDGGKVLADEKIIKTSK